MNQLKEKLKKKKKASEPMCNIIDKVKNREELWKEIFSKIDKACEDEGWHKDGICKLLKRIQELTEKKVDKTNGQKS